MVESGSRLLLILLLFVEFIHSSVDSLMQRTRLTLLSHNSNLFAKTSRTQLHSYGDPDLSSESNFYRDLQEFLRSFDKTIYPDEPDIPGVTFLSPVEWAPWMETIWFGNIYDYRSAFFHDVMYSNSKPFKEGALLYKDSYRSLMIALLYQRYKRFDTSSYSLANATFFNVFGGQALRVGRYKAPLTNEVILCTTDPLTSTEMKRYLNTFNPIKWFASQYFQQKRKRQYIMDITDSSSSSTATLLKNTVPPPPGKLSAGSSNFLFDSVYLIEYGRLAMSDRAKETSVTIPVAPLPLQSILRARIEVGSNHRAVLGAQMSEANSQYFLENLFQSVLAHLSQEHGIDFKSMRILLGGDGRLINDLAMEVAIRVAVGNSVSRIQVAEDNLLSSDVAAQLCSKSASLTASGKDTKAATLPNVAIVFSSDKQGGIKGHFGVSVVYTPGGNTKTQDDKSNAIWINQDSWLDLLTQMSTRRYVKISPARFLPPLDATVRARSGAVTAVEGEFPVETALIKSLKAQFDFPKLKASLAASGLIFTVDALGSRLAAGHIRAVLRELGVEPETVLLNPPSDGSQDFNGLIPGGLPSHSSDSAALFNLPESCSTSLADLQMLQNELEAPLNNDTVVGATGGDIRSSGRETSESDFSDCPDIGFVFNADASSCAVLLPGVSLTPGESAELLQKRGLVPVGSERQDGLREMLHWLTLLVSKPSGSVSKDILLGLERSMTATVNIDISLSAAVAALNTFRRLESQTGIEKINSVTPISEATLENATSVLLLENNNDQESTRGVTNITVISKFLPEIRNVSVQLAGNSSVDEEMSIIELIGKLVGSQVSIVLEDYPQVIVSVELSPANAAAQLLLRPELAEVSLTTNLSELFNQTTSYEPSRALTLSLTASAAVLQTTGASDDLASMGRRRSTMVDDLLKAIVKTLLATDSKELVPAVLIPEYIKIVCA